MNYTEANKEKKSKSSHSKHNHHHHHHHGRSKHRDPSSEMERRGQNIIYDRVRKEKIKEMMKRSAFLILAVTIVLLLIYFITLPDDVDHKFFYRDNSEEEVNLLKNKIIDYEYYIEELEERLSKYENVESIFDKNE